MDWSWLIALVCPLMMVFMMFGMKGHGHGLGLGHRSASDQSSQDQAVQEQLNELKAQNEQMKQEIQKLTKENVS